MLQTTFFATGILTFSAVSIVVIKELINDYRSWRRWRKQQRELNEQRSKKK